jgi:hypothetical protein
LRPYRDRSLTLLELYDLKTGFKGEKKVSVSIGSPPRLNPTIVIYNALLAV